MRRRPLALAAVACALLGAALPATAAAQEPAPEPPPPPPPGPAPPAAPDVILSARNVRMTKGGMVGLRVACRATSASQSGEACIGSLTVRLSNAVVIEVPRPGDKPPIRRRIAPFAFGVGDFTLAVGEAMQLRVRLSPRAQQLVRGRERLRVDLIARYNSRAGAHGAAQRNVRVYFPTRPEA
jgi:hypothetical protein